MATAQLDVKGGDVPSRVDYPAHNAVTVTPSDSVVQKYRSLWVGGVGDVAVIPLCGDTAVTFVAVAAGTLLPVAVSKVMATNTDATLIVGLI